METGAGGLAIPAHLRSTGDPGSYIIQARGPVTAAFRQRLQEAGAAIVSYIPNNAYLVRATSDAVSQIESAAETQGVIPFEPYYKLDSKLLPLAVDQKALAANDFLRLTFFPGTELEGRQAIEALGGFVESHEPSPFGPQVVVSGVGGSLAEVARLTEVQTVELEAKRVLANDLTRVQMGVSPDTLTPSNYLGLSGTNVWININDSGVDRTHPDFYPTNLYAPSPNYLRDFNGHGTFVAGVLAGNGSASSTVTLAEGSITNANFSGMAPGAGLIVLPITFSPEVGPPVADTFLQETAASINANVFGKTNTLISNNSWTYLGVSEYNSAAARFDAAVRDALPEQSGDHPVAYVFAAGNSGFGNENGLSGESDSIDSPGTAKNVLTVGSIEHLRLLSSQIVTTNITVEPGPTNNVTVTNYLTNFVFRAATDSDTEVAAFSSRGNVGIGTEGDFGRFKPDVIAPGSFLVSARSKDWKLENQISTNSPLYPLLKDADDKLGGKYRYESGTTVSAPVISGMMALIQEYFEQKLPVALRHSPSPALLKAAIINGARSVNAIYDVSPQNVINYQGWGLPRMDRALPSMLNGNPDPATWPVQFIDQSPTNALATGDSRTWVVALSTNAEISSFRATLVWTDPPGNPAAAIKLVNDLDLIVTNLETGAIFYGNNIPVGTDFTIGIVDTNTPPVYDLVNNVENVFIPEPLTLGTRYSVSVVARRVNVSAVSEYNRVTGKTNDVAQDFALVIASGDTTLTNVFTSITGPVTNAFQRPLPLTITNGLPLVNQRAGANPSLIVTNGFTNQWRFYVFTNTFMTNELFSLTNGTNVAFVTYLPPNLSRPRNFEADIDMFVSTNAGLLNLNPAVIATAKSSKTRTGTELVVYTNAVLDQVFYVAIKSEDQQGAEFGLIVISTNDPFETERNGVRYLRVFPAERFLPDGSANLPQAAVGVAIGVSQGIVQRARAEAVISHEEVGDLVGTLYHSQISAVLNNHTLNLVPPNGQTFSGTNAFFYNDSGEPDPVLREIHTDGPGSLNDFVGSPALGPWIFQMVDNSPSHVGRLESMFIKVEPFVGGNLADLSGSSQQVTTNITYYIDVPPGATNLTIEVNPAAALEMYARKDFVPTDQINFYDYKAVTVSNVLVLKIGKGDKPPLTPGRYYIRVYHKPPGTSVTFTIKALLEYEFNPDLEGRFISGSTILLPDNALVTSTFTVASDRTVADVEVGVRIDHPRVSDLVLHLISPQGTRIALAENRGGTNTDGFGSGFTTNLNYAVFTEDTTLAALPIKFVPPPFSKTNLAAGFPLLNSFEGATNGVYPGGAGLDGWTVVGNSVTAVVQPGFAPNGNKFIALCDSGISTNVTLIPGKQYVLRFASRSPLRLVGTGLDDDRLVLPGGVQDPHFVLVQSGATNSPRPAYVATQPLPAGWIGLGNRSAWIIPTSFGSPNVGAGAYRYLTLFDLCGYRSDFPRISGNWAQDDLGVDILINGQAAGRSGTGPGTMQAFSSISTGGNIRFNPGINTLEMIIQNSAAGPTGVRAEFNLQVTPISTNVIPSAGLVRIGGTTISSFPGTPHWFTNLITFVAATNNTQIEILGNNFGLWIDTVDIHESGNVYFQPEEPLSVLKGERAKGEWTLEIWDTKAGPTPGLFSPIPALISWTLNIDFGLPNPPAITLTNGVAYTGILYTNTVQYFVIETCPDTSFAINTLSGPARRLRLLADHDGFPTDNPETDDFEPILNQENNTNVIQRAILSLTPASPVPAPLRPGKPYFLAIRNVNTLETNAFTLLVDMDGACATNQSSSSSVPLARSVPVRSQVATGKQRTFIFTITESSSTANFDLSPVNGNVDLVVSRENPPTYYAFDFISTNPALLNDRITVNASSSIPDLRGNWYAGVINREDYPVDFSITAFAVTTGTGGENPIVILGAGVNPANGRFEIQWTSAPGKVYAVDVSSDLANWTQALQIGATSATTTFSEPTGFAIRFYRIRAL